MHVSLVTKCEQSSGQQFICTKKLFICSFLSCLSKTASVCSLKEQFMDDVNRINY